MSNTSALEKEVSQILLYTAREDNQLENTTFNISENVTGNITESINGSNIHESYLLDDIIFYMAEYPWLMLIFGVPGNVASIFTIMSMSTVSSSKAHVAILALTDTVAIVTKVIYWQASGYAVQLTVPGCILIMFTQQFSSTYANWVVVAMTTERFLAVWFPLRVGRMYTRRKALIVLTCLAITTTFVYLFFFWSWTEVETNEVYHGYFCVIKSEYDNFVNEFRKVEPLYSQVLPCLLILIGNILIITNIKRARKAQRHLTNAFDQGGRKARDQKQITVMLIVVSIVFLVLNMPSALFYCFKSLWVYEIGTYDYAKYVFTARFFHVLADANHAVNFYLYFLSMSSFRRRFLEAVRCRRHTNRRPGTSVSRTSQTYLHSGHLVCDPGRLDNSTCYSGYKRSSSNIVEHAHPLKALGSSNNNRTSHEYQLIDNRNGIQSASSNV